MGLKDKMKKKKSDEDSDDEIGGLTDQEEFRLNGESEEVEGEVSESMDKEAEGDEEDGDDDGETMIPEPEAEPEVSEEATKEDGGALSSLDLFSQETIEEEGNLLAKQLPEMDINDVLEECREVLRLLNEGLGQEQGTES